ncbi:MAG: hypothetical protein WA064_03735 [Candidatus Moraniibacteriota bacterium]
MREIKKTCGVKTRIGLMSLTGKPGSVEMPDGIVLSCPRCGQLLADKGQCLAEFIIAPCKESKTGFTLELLADCRGCGYNDGPPAVDF